MRTDIYRALLKHRELEREKAYEKYGNEWRNHVPWGKFFSAEPQSMEEFHIVRQMMDVCEVNHA